MDHPVLGKLEACPHPQLSDCLVGCVTHHDSKIDLMIEPDGDDIGLAVDLASNIVERLEHYISLSLSHAATSLVDSYNDNWREYEVSDGEGGRKDVSNPPLSAEELATRLQLASIGVTSDQVVELVFHDGGLFAGHSVFVESFDGLKFTELNASLYG